MDRENANTEAVSTHNMCSTWGTGIKSKMDDKLERNIAMMFKEE
jgi:hypothetical protein